MPAVVRNKQVRQITHCIEMAQSMAGILMPLLDNPLSEHSLYILNQTRRCGRSVRKLMVQLEDLKYAITCALTDERSR